MYPIFFSVASADLMFAESVWTSFGSDLVYLYSKAGRQGAEFWTEIESDELPNARGLVIFWSWSFVRSVGTRRELERAGRLFKSGQLRSVVILRLDDCPISAPAGLAADSEAKAFSDLAPFLSVTRTSEASVSVAIACRLCDAMITQYVVPAPPIFPRPSVEEEFFRQTRIDHRTFRPMVWVSGLNGNGRRTVVREAFRRIDPNAVAVEVDVSECSIPKQLVLRLESEGFQCSEAQLEALNADPSRDTPSAIASVIERIRLSGRYAVLRQQRVMEERVALPEWLLDVALELEVTGRPAVFVVAAAPAGVEWLQRAGDKLAAMRVASFLPHEAEEFAWNLIRHFDSAAERWSDDFVRRLVNESGGTPELILLRFP